MNTLCDLCRGWKTFDPWAPFRSQHTDMSLAVKERPGASPRARYPHRHHGLLSKKPLEELNAEAEHGALKRTFGQGRPDGRR